MDLLNDALCINICYKNYTDTVIVNLCFNKKLKTPRLKFEKVKIITN